MSAAKRPRLEGSFSPASPPYHLAKGANEFTKQPFQPDTPTSPPTSMNSSAASIDSTSQQHASSGSTQMPTSTPATSVAGTVSFAANDGDGDATMTDGGDAHRKEEDVEMADPDTHTRTDHDRQESETVDVKASLKARMEESMLPLYKIGSQRKGPCALTPLTHPT